MAGAARIDCQGMEDFSDIFSDLDGWQVVASGQAVGRLSRIDGPERTAGLQLDFDFHGGGGFVVIRRVVRWVLPEAFEIGFSLRGAGLRNHFEFKVVDGANAWRFLRQDYDLADGWERVRVVATTGWRFAGFPVSRRAPFAWRPGLRALASCYWGEVSLSHGPSRSSLSESDRGRPVVWHPDPSRRFRAAVLH